MRDFRKLRVWERKDAAVTENLNSDDFSTSDSGQQTNLSITCFSRLTLVFLAKEIIRSFRSKSSKSSECLPLSRKN